MTTERMKLVELLKPNSENEKPKIKQITLVFHPDLVVFEEESYKNWANYMLPSWICPK